MTKIVQKKTSIYNQWEQHEKQIARNIQILTRKKSYKNSRKKRTAKYKCEQKQKRKTNTNDRKRGKSIYLFIIV